MNRQYFFCQPSPRLMKSPARPNPRTANSKPRPNFIIPGPGSGPGQILPPVFYCTLVFSPTTGLTMSKYFRPNIDIGGIRLHLRLCLWQDRWLSVCARRSGKWVFLATRLAASRHHFHNGKSLIYGIGFRTLGVMVPEKCEVLYLKKASMSTPK